MPSPGWTAGAIATRADDEANPVELRTPAAVGAKKNAGQANGAAKTSVGHACHVAKHAPARSSVVAFLSAMPPRGRSSAPPPCRCQALNKAGRPCGIASDSRALDAAGRLAAGPLLQGGLRCLFHARWFCTVPLEQGAQAEPMLVYLDLETTGLSLLADEICEVGLLAAESKAAYSSVVRPSVLPPDAGFHGISPRELAFGPCFQTVFLRVARFLNELAAAALSDDSNSEDEAAPGPLRLRSTLPVILLAVRLKISSLQRPRPVSQSKLAFLSPGSQRHQVRLCDDCELLLAQRQQLGALSGELALRRHA